MITYTISYSTALRNWVLMKGQTSGLMNTVVEIGPNPRHCLEALGDRVGVTQETKFAIMIDNLKSINTKSVVPGLSPLENSTHGRASRAALGAYGSILREHGQTIYADQLQELIDEAEAAIAEKIT